MLLQVSIPGVSLKGPMKVDLGQKRGWYLMDAAVINPVPFQALFLLLFEPTYYGRHVSVSGWQAKLVAGFGRTPFAILICQELLKRGWIATNTDMSVM